MPTSPALRVALIGYGYAGKTFHAPLIRATPGLQMRCIATRDAAAVHALDPAIRVEADYQAATGAPDVDLVVIATPNDSHHPLARSALEAGKAVVVDKPFTLDLAQARDLVDLARAQGVLLSVFQNRRWDGDFLTLAEHLRRGHLGEVREFVSRFDRYEPQPRDRWRERLGPGSGLWMDLGPHLLDQVLCLFGPPDELEADLASLREADGSVDHAQVTLHYVAPRRRVTLHCSRLTALPAARFEAHGTLGSLVSTGLDVQEGQLKSGMDPQSPGWGQDPRPLRWADWRELERLDRPEAVIAASRIPREPVDLPRRNGDYGAYYRQMHDALRGTAPLPVRPDEALQVMHLLELAERSAREGRRLQVGRPG